MTSQSIDTRVDDLESSIGSIEKVMQKILQQMEKMIKQQVEVASKLNSIPSLEREDAYGSSGRRIKGEGPDPNRFKAVREEQIGSLIKDAERKRVEAVSSRSRALEGSESNIPTLNGNNPEEWILLAEKHFALKCLNNEEQLEVAVSSFEGVTLRWFQRENHRRPIRRWVDLKWMILRQFCSITECSSGKPFLTLKQGVATESDNTEKNSKKKITTSEVENGSEKENGKIITEEERADLEGQPLLSIFNLLKPSGYNPKRTPKSTKIEVSEESPPLRRRHLKSPTPRLSSPSIPLMFFLQLSNGSNAGSIERIQSSKEKTWISSKPNPVVSIGPKSSPITTIRPKSLPNLRWIIFWSTKVVSCAVFEIIGLYNRHKLLPQKLLPSLLPPPLPPPPPLLPPLPRPQLSSPLTAPTHGSVYWKNGSKTTLIKFRSSNFLGNPCFYNRLYCCYSSRLIKQYHQHTRKCIILLFSLSVYAPILLYKSKEFFEDLSSFIDKEELLKVNLEKQKKGEGLRAPILKVYKEINDDLLVTSRSSGVGIKFDDIRGLENNDLAERDGRDHHARGSANIQGWEGLTKPNLIRVLERQWQFGNCIWLVSVSPLGKRRLLGKRNTGTQHRNEVVLNQLLSLMTNTTYDDTKIFLRELINNSSNGLVKDRFESFSGKSKRDAQQQLKIIWLVSGKVNKTLSIIVDDIREVWEARETDVDVSMIGLLDVGFYGVNLVAKMVNVITKHNDEEQYAWESQVGGIQGVNEEGIEFE